MEDFIFPIKLVSEKLDESFDLSKIKKFISEQKENNLTETRSNKGGWQSKNYKYSKDTVDDSLIPFVDLVDRAIKTYSNGSRFGHLNNVEVYLRSFWMNVNSPGAHNVLHIHPGSVLSGVFWVSCPENCGRLIVRHPNEMVNYYLGPDELSIDPQEGLLVLFPSYLPHLVEPNQSSEDRISISFNLSIKQ